MNRNKHFMKHQMKPVDPNKVWNVIFESVGLVTYAAFIAVAFYLGLVLLHSFF